MAARAFASAPVEAGVGHGVGDGLTAPVSFAQERLWVLEQLEPGNPANNLRAALRVRGPVDVELLRTSLQQVVDRHEALRTSFATVDARPVQVVHPSVPVALHLADLTEDIGAPRAERLRRAIAATVQAPFDLTIPPLVRATLFRTAADEHLLLFVAHHILCDGWSLGILIRELLELYAAGREGRAAALAELPLQYRDFAVWQRETLTGAPYERLLAYWSQQLADLPTILPLPTDRPRPPAQTFVGSSQTRRLPPALVDKLERAGRDERATLFMALLAGFAAVLSRYTDRDDIAVGSAIANRRRAEHETLIGFFVNSLVLRVDLGGDPTFRELLRRVREMALDAFDHQDMPFERLVEELNPPRSASHPPLIQVMLVLQNLPLPSMDVGGLHCEPVDVLTGMSRFDLTLFASRTAGGLDLVAEFNADLFDDATIARLLEHLEFLLERAVADPDRAVAHLPLEAVARATPARGDDAPHGAPDRCIHQLFEEQVRRTPDETALRAASAETTYRTLNRHANLVARELVALGVQRGDHVAISVERSPEMVAGLLGIMKAGAAYVPLEPDQPLARRRDLLADSGASAVVVRRAAVGEWDHDRLAVVAVDELDSPLTDGADVPDLDLPAEPDDVAYVIYTSGSTGAPKGVLGLHRGAVNRFDWMWRTFPFSAGEMCCQKTALSFGDSVWEIFGPLLQGVPQLIVPDRDVKDPRRFIEVLADHRVTRVVLVPALLRAILAEQPALGERLPALRLWVSSGEALTPDVRDAFYRSAPDARLLNLYGSSEVSADVLWHDTRHDPPGSPVPLGRPIDNTHVVLLDRHLQPVPTGLAGEIHVGGDGLARGYHGRPALTAERFIADPFASDGRARLYRTGDIGRCDPDGVIHFLGRRDRQVKVRGYRIELDEIEAVLCSHPGLRGAAVSTDETPLGDTRIVAYLVPDPDAGPTAGDARAFLAARLPAYMIPAVFVVLDELPLTTGGKVDRLRLPSPDSHEAPPDADAPRTELEAQLAAIWERCLGRHGIGRDDDFFDLGGHSLVALPVVHEIETLTGQRLPPTALFDAPTIAQLSAVLDSGEWSASSRCLVPIRTRGAKHPLFVVPGVGGVVFTLRHLKANLDPERPLYGLQAQGLTGADPHTSVEDMASAYLDEIRGVQPHGPYLLGGVCFGGRVAFEMARQLAAGGDEVGAVIVVETYAPGIGGFRSKVRLPGWRRRAMKFKAQAETFGPIGWLSLLVDQRRHGRALRTKWALERSDAVTVRSIIRVRRSNIRAVMAYAPPPYPGPVTVVRGTRDGPELPDLGWAEFAEGGVEVHDVPGRHGQVLKNPHVHALAETLNECLDRTGL